MLRQIDVNSQEEILKQLQILKFIQRHKKEIIEELNGTKLNYSVMEDSIDLFDGLSFHKTPTENFKGTIDIINFMLHDYNISCSSENIYDTEINQKYIEYINKTFDLSIDEYDVLSEFYDHDNDEYIMNEGGTNAEMQEYVICSSEIDSFLDTYDKESDMYKKFIYNLTRFSKIFTECGLTYIDVRTKDNKYFDLNNIIISKYQVWVTIFISTSGYYYDKNGYYYANNNCNEYNEILEDVWHFNNFLKGAKLIECNTN